VAAGITFAAKYRSESETPPAPVATPVIPVIAGTVDSHEVPIYARGVGTVIAYNNAVVRSQFTGQLISINFAQGQTVKKDDLLAEIDPRPYQAQLDQAVANRDRDQAQLDIAQKNLNRYVPLEGKGFATPQPGFDLGRAIQLDAVGCSGGHGDFSVFAQLLGDRHSGPHGVPLYLVARPA
jgi:multidrug efflux system membrane fusion protein